MRANRFRPPSDQPGARIVFGGVGLIFAGIGVTVLAFLWGAPWGEFGSPPLFFRVFGSFIALAFVLIGGGQFVAVTMGRGLAGQLDEARRLAEQLGDGDEPGHRDARSAASPGYTCPQCGAPLAAGADVSPHGDVKCGYCASWFNVHGRR